MASRNTACIVAAGFLGLAITAAATDAHARTDGSAPAIAAVGTPGLQAKRG